MADRVDLDDGCPAGGDRPPYFVVSPFLITALSFAEPRPQLGADQPLYVFQPQGMDSDAAAHTTSSRWRPTTSRR